MRYRSLFALLVAVALFLSGPAFAQDESVLVQRRNEVREVVHDSLAALYEAAPGTRVAIERAAGYGVFSTFGLKIFFGGGTTGRGS